MGFGFVFGVLGVCPSIYLRLHNYKKIDINGRGTVTRDEVVEFGRSMNSKFDEEKPNTPGFLKEMI